MINKHSINRAAFFICSKGARARGGYGGRAYRRTSGGVCKTARKIKTTKIIIDKSYNRGAMKLVLHCGNSSNTKATASFPFSSCKLCSFKESKTKNSIITEIN